MQVECSEKGKVSLREAWKRGQGSDHAEARGAVVRSLGVYF